MKTAADMYVQVEEGKSSNKLCPKKAAAEKINSDTKKITAPEDHGSFIFFAPKDNPTKNASRESVKRSTDIYIKKITAFNTVYVISGFLLS
ncbi:MAG: hypothetical protein Q8882_02360 [Bacillota bacterium]|nr:hypothetical protein [Bacillota bacterium]